MTRDPARIDPILARASVIDFSEPHESICSAVDHGRCSPAYGPEPMPVTGPMQDIVCDACGVTIGSTSADAAYSYRCECGHEGEDEGLTL